jgi:hypothetical protein
VVVKDRALARQAVEVRRLDPTIPVRSQKAQVQAVADDDNDIHDRDCSERFSPCPGQIGRLNRWLE